jgi:hypothetical protein
MVVPAGMGADSFSGQDLGQPETAAGVDIWALTGYGAQGQRGKTGAAIHSCPPEVDGYLGALRTWDHVSGDDKCWPEFDDK